ncbi:MAG: DUF45 domain-containing protein [Clostridia bacterium]|nr:DUF45 domain-containing protein [Clostridia bacterium]
MINYTLHIKNVKNINLRIKPDGSVHVSANRFVKRSVIDEFVKSKETFILKALKEYAEKRELPKISYYSEEELKSLIVSLCEKAYPYFEERGLKAFPEIKFKKMKSRWGSCHPKKGILTFSTHLKNAPYECILYVVLHEFTHFLQANHSKQFYEEFEKVCPCWKEHKKRLKEISI